MKLADVRVHAERLGRIVYMATVRTDGRPHNAPVGVAWVDDHVCAFIQNPSVKVANIYDGSGVHLHWSVGAESNNDSLVLEGEATIVDTTEGRNQLWNHMGYNLDDFEPGGPSSDDHVFVKVRPERATILYRFGFDGRETWQLGDEVIDLRNSTPISSS